jgi:hypothetical protein
MVTSKWQYAACNRCDVHAPAAASQPQRTHGHLKVAAHVITQTTDCKLVTTSALPLSYCMLPSQHAGSL